MRHERAHPRRVFVDDRPPLFAAHHRLAMVYGGGGVFGIAYTAGVAAGLAATGVPVVTAPALGTSAGSWTAAAIALGLTYDDFQALGSPRCRIFTPGSSPTSADSCSATPPIP
jgi:NTE family protein